MKILYLCTFYHIALLYHQQKTALEKRNHSVSVFNSAEYGAGVEEKFLPAVQEKSVVHVECWSDVDRLLFFPRQWKIEKQLQKAYDLHDFDLLHAHLLVSSGYTARRMKKKYGLPYVLSVRGTDLKGFIRAPFFRRMAIKNAEEAGGILFLSRCHKEAFLNKYVPESKRALLEKKSVIIGNPLEKFWEEHTAETARSFDPSNVRILMIGRIDANKNVPLAAQAVKILREKGINASFTVVGEVAEQEEAEKLKAYDFLELLPFMGHKELLEVYRQHDIFLMPSKSETFGRVYTEAMSQGLPVLYTKGQGFDKAYPDGEVGYSVPSDNPDYIADRLSDIISDYGRLSKNCIKHVSDFYEDNIIDKIEQFYFNSLQEQ